MGEEIGGDGALGEVVDALPVAAGGADGVAAEVEGFEGELGVGPGPPAAAAFACAADVGCGDGAFAEAGADFGEGLLRDLDAVDAAAHLGASEGEVGPGLDGEDAGGVCVVLEGAGGLAPVGVFDAGARGRAGAGVGDELVRAGEDGDGVELDGTGAAEDVGGGFGSIGGEREALRAEGDAAGVVGGEVGLGCWGECGCARHGGSVRIGGGRREAGSELRGESDGRWRCSGRCVKEGDAKIGAALCCSFSGGRPGSVRRWGSSGSRGSGRPRWGRWGRG